MNQHDIYFRAASLCMVFAFFANSNAQNAIEDTDRADRKRVEDRLPTWEMDLKHAISKEDLSEVAALQDELSALLATMPMLVKQHRRISDMVVEHRLAGMLPALAKNLNRRIWIGSSMRAYTTQYPLTRAIVAFGQRSLNPVKEQLLKSKEWYEVEVLAYCLMGIQGAEDARKSLQALQRQVSDKELRDLFLRAEDWISRYHHLFMVDFAEDKIPRISEDEMLFVELPDKANATLDESSPSRTPTVKPDLDGRMETPVQKGGLADRLQDSATPASSTRRSIVVVLILAATGLLWLLVKKLK